MNERAVVSATQILVFVIEKVELSMNVNHVYAGNLLSGQSIVSISGYVDRETCDYAIEKLEELLTEDAERIVFDCSDVRNLPQWWFADKVKELYPLSIESGQITVRLHEIQESLKPQPAAEISSVV